MTESKGCTYCKEVSLGSYAKYKINDNIEIQGRVRIDTETNQIDSEVVMINKEKDEVLGAWSDNYIPMNYCPNCGKKMPEIK